ncbi:hypothetical protein [Blastococcus deserti]|uniref:Neocarzinostatin family protein n=1 Tax=Blastococcus deserti TaxID=2259033 RepID=A0ABW4X802_9ACTN
MTSALPARPALSAGLLTGLVALFVGAGLAAAAPAAAIDDPTRPDARVTHGPSCRPGGLVVEIVAGTAPYTVRLATTRAPAGEDEAVLQPGETVVLRSGDVAYGETIDGRLEYTAQDGSGAVWTDELEEYSFTRPAQEDCAALAAPTTPEPAPPTTTSPTASPGGSAEAGAPGASSSAPAPGQPWASGSAVPAAGAGEPLASGADAGEIVTVQAAGFLPGERVTIRLRNGGNVLGTAVASSDGTVQARIRIPDGSGAGTTTVDLVGSDSAVVADVELQVAGAGRPAPAEGWRDLVPLTAAAVALVGTVAGLASVAGSQRAAGRRHAGTGSA